MAYPPAYVRAYSFTDYETNNPGQPKPGAQLDMEYDAVSNALTATQTNLALIQRADGALANGSVGEDQLEAGIFDGITDGITADAEAAAAAAAASASLAAGYATDASASASAAATSAATASGGAAQAGVSQGIAQNAANEAALSASNAFDSAQIAANAGNEAMGFRNEASLHEETAFKWAELLTGPVMPAPPGWPEAVDDGMFSAKWWAIRARDYMTVTHLDLGTGQANIGDAFADWLAIPGNEMPLGLIYATWGTPPLEYALTDPTDPTDPASWTLISGGPGPAGPPNTLTPGTITTGAPGSSVIVTITGVSPNQVLNMTIPRGDTGATGPIGPAGPPNALAIGTVTTVPDGTPAAAGITGTAPTQTLNLTIPAGPQGIQGIQGPIGPAGTPAFANPTATITLANQPGVATTAMRSDAAPALSQGISPVWTGLHAFTGANALFGTTISVSVGNSHTVQQFGTGSGTSGHSITRGSADAAGPRLNFGKTRSVAYDATTPVQSGDVCGQISWLGADGTNFNTTAAQIIGLCSGAVSTGVVPGELRFLTASAAGALTERFRMSNFGGLAIAGSFGTAGQVMTSQGNAAAPSWAAIALAAANFANPSASLGLAAVNGVALTAMRSDAAPALSQAIAPTWTGQHIWGLPLRGSVGTALLPTFSFNSDPDTGMWDDSPDSISFSVGGVAEMLIRPQGLLMVNSGRVFLSNGTAALPGLTFLADQDTGIYGSGDTVLITVGGTNRVVFNAAGIIMDAGSRFFSQDGSAASPAYSFLNDQATGMWRSAASTLDWSIGGVNTMELTATTLFGPSFASGSSRALKRETGKPSMVGNILARLRPILYRLLADERQEQLGLIAEEVHEVCPQLSDGKTVCYDRLAILLLAAWQDEHVVA